MGTETPALQNAIATITLARLAAHEAANTLTCAESWLKEMNGVPTGHVITSRAQISEAENHALRALRLCVEASQELRILGGDETAKCHAILDSLGMPHEDHGEERTLTVFERLETLAAEYRDLQWVR